MSNYLVKNISGQVINIEIVKGNALANHFLENGKEVVSERKTDQIERLEFIGCLQISEMREVEPPITIVEVQPNIEKEPDIIDNVSNIKEEVLIKEETVLPEVVSKDVEPVTAKPQTSVTNNKKKNN